jgi:alcohol-forming fatty acyl-CoA reductase
LQIFDRFREQQPGVLQQKLFGINVNYDVDNLRIAKSDLVTIIEEVDVFYHAMASVKFNEKLKDAINVNIFGTKRVLELAKQVQNLKAFVHVSTCYTQCHRTILEEKIDVSPINCQQLLEMTTNLSIEQVEKLKDGLIDVMPNTYTLTKRYAEELVFSEPGGKMPIGIFRPPILGSIYKQPLPGWTDNVYGPMSLSLAFEKGYIHCMKIDETRKCNAAPVDYCVNALIAVAWDVGVKAQLGCVIPIYNYLSNENNCTWKELAKLYETIPQDYPLEGPIWHKFIYQCDNDFTYMVLFYLLHLVPGFVLDCLLMLAGKKRQ